MSDYVRRLREKVGHDLLFWPSVACLVRDDDGALLLVRHVEGRWTLPAGAMDPGESPAEAARRETREEASVDVEPRIVGGEAKPGDDETAEVRWVTEEDALAMDVTAATRHVLESVRAGRAFDG
jgi:8-oxo-dGTP pyrophosphatase MutT (NUDIX family)